MKKFLSNMKTILALLIVTIVTLGIYAYMLARPISYGMEYYNKTEYNGGTFEGAITFKSDNTMINRNSNFDEELKSFYYYKDGYIFFTLAQTSEEYAEEVAYINENFDEAVATPFYADKINAFELVAEESDGYKSVYTCTNAITFAIAGGIVELLLIGLTITAFIFNNKSKHNEEE